MAYEVMTKTNTERIIGCYGVNKYALGMYEDINYATSKTAKKQVAHRLALLDPGGRAIDQVRFTVR
jgi:hypothetical protein